MKVKQACCAMLVFTWSSQNTAHQLTLVTIELFERDGGTELVLTQTGLPDATAFQAHIHGWTSILDQLAFPQRVG
jgi:uncharacterized protein YndB with AHSA1/START domain